jgi:hypothetical protein
MHIISVTIDSMVPSLNFYSSENRDLRETAKRNYDFRISQNLPFRQSSL